MPTKKDLRQRYSKLLRSETTKDYILEVYETSFGDGTYQNCFNYRFFERNLYLRLAENILPLEKRVYYLSDGLDVIVILPLEFQDSWNVRFAKLDGNDLVFHRKIGRKKKEIRLNCLSDSNFLKKEIVEFVKLTNVCEVGLTIREEIRYSRKENIFNYDFLVIKNNFQEKINIFSLKE